MNEKLLNSMKILVVGGAGYIGSHMVKYLLAKGYTVTIFDNFSTGFRDAVVGGELMAGDLADRVALSSLFASHPFDAVMHFASFISVGESVAKPDLYYANNLFNTFNLLQAMREAGCPPFVFSSTAAVYGTPMIVPITPRRQTSCRLKNLTLRCGDNNGITIFSSIHRAGVIQGIFSWPAVG